MCTSNNITFGNLGFIAGAFDLLHPGYIQMFIEAKKHCNHLIVGLHVDPSIERGKLKPILSLEDRMSALLSIRYIDEVIPYDLESDLEKILLKEIDIRFLGDDYKNKQITCNIVPIYFINRSFWSTTKLRELILKSN